MDQPSPLKVIYEERTKKCPYCAEQINAEAIKCKHCGSNLIQNTNSNTIPACTLCGGEMKKTTEAKSSGTGCLVVLVSLFLILLGWSLPFALGGPVLFFVGAILFIYGLVLASRRRGLWACKACGHQLERRLKWHER